MHSLAVFTKLNKGTTVLLLNSKPSWNSSDAISSSTSIIPRNTKRRENFRLN